MCTERAQIRTDGIEPRPRVDGEVFEGDGREARARRRDSLAQASRVKKKRLARGNHRVATLIINTAIALIYYGQLRQMKKATKAATESANLSREALTSVQRAFVFVTTLMSRGSIGQDNETSSDGSMRIAFQWENGGNTPTKDMSTHISVRWFHRPLPDNFSFSDYPKDEDPSLKMFVGPKAVNRAAPIVVSARDIMAIHNHSGHLYFWGWAKYHDVFPDSPEHITRLAMNSPTLLVTFPLVPSIFKQPVVVTAIASTMSAKPSRAL